MVQPISNQVGFYPRPLVGNTSYMPVNVSNLFVATPKGKQVQMNMLTNILLHR